MSGNPAENERLMVEQCRLGDRRAWDEFFHTHYHTISSVVSWKKWRFLPEEREDVVQDVVSEVIKSIRTFDMGCSVTTFVYRIALNTCVTRLRYKTAQKRRTDFLKVHLDSVVNDEDHDSVQVSANPATDPEASLLAAEKASFLRKALASMEDRCRELVTLRYLMELSFGEITEKLGVKQNTLVVQMKRCLARLFKMVEGVI